MRRSTHSTPLAYLALLHTLWVAGCGRSEPSLSGEISISPELARHLTGTEVLFIIARRPGQRLPLAVQRLRAAEFPFRFYLTETDKLVPTATFAGQVEVTARLDVDGMAGPPQPGDLEGRYPGNPAAVGDRHIDIIIKQRVTQAPAGARATPPAPATPATRQAAAPADGYDAQARPARRSISGEITVAPELAARLRGNEVVFIIARGGAPGPPLAVKRLQAPSFPLRFSLTEADKMIPTLAFEGTVNLIVRVDADGRAGPAQPGDLEGRISATVGERNVKVVISHLVAQPQVGSPVRPALGVAPSRQPAGTPPSSKAASGQLRTDRSDASAGGAARSLSGEISITTELGQYLKGTEVLYIIVRSAAPGPPLAVKRVQAPSFPLRFSFTEADAMLHTAAFAGPVNVVARVDADGMAGPPTPGDMEGTTPGSIGDMDIKIVIDKRY